jgi:acyl-coenzyme A synthetase/AMP-(fatty) acid ligase
MSAPLLPELLHLHATTRPGMTALMTDAGDVLTYREWWQRARDDARALVAAGVAPGERIALIGSNAAYCDSGVAYLALLMAGATVLTLATAQSREELEQAIERAGVRRVVICDPELTPSPGWDVWTPEAAEPDGALPALADDMPAELLNTSGTTGLPRLVEATHGNLAHDYARKPLLGDEPCHLVHALTLGTNAGQVVLRSSLTLGYAIVAMRAFDVGTYMRLARELPMRETLLVPAMAASLVAEAARHDWVLLDVEGLAVSGAATPPSTWRGLARLCPNATIGNTYTTTEAWPARALMFVDAERPESVGRPMDGQGIEIRDERGEPVGPGVQGTIHLRDVGAGARRYAEAAAPSRVHAGGWVETDDLGYLDDDGYLYLVDRKSDVISAGGYTVSTLEVERALAEHPHVVEAAVLGLPHGVLGEAVAACVAGAPELDADDVRRHAQERLAAHKVPHVVRVLDELPRTRSGKVAKRILREQLLSHDPAHAPTAPASSLEQAIQAIWEEVLERRGIGVDEPFFAAGGDSLSALRVVARIREQLAAEVSTSSLLTAATIAEQAVVVERARSAA